MKGRPKLTTSRAAEIYREVLEFRRLMYEDHEFFTMTDVLENLASDLDGWKIRKYKSPGTADHERKAGVVSFGGLTTITVDERLWEKAEAGDALSNFILAHEFGHLMLGHHNRSAITKHFQLFSGPNGMSNIPPTQEELETNFAAVFFQCGIALEDQRWETARLVERSYSDYRTVKKAQTYVRFEAFQKELWRLSNRFPRVVL